MARLDVLQYRESGVRCTNAYEHIHMCRRQPLVTKCHNLPILIAVTSISAHSTSGKDLNHSGWLRAPTHYKCTQVRDCRRAYHACTRSVSHEFSTRGDKWYRRSADSVPTDSRLVMGRLFSSQILLWFATAKCVERYRCIVRLNNFTRQIMIAITSKREFQVGEGARGARCRGTVLDKCKYRCHKIEYYIVRKGKERKRMLHP